MYILVDYDNVDIPLRKNGVKNVLERIASTLCQHVQNLPQRFEFRLYGGWYDQTTMTRNAQDISAQLTRDFPNVFIPFPTYQTKISLVLQAELARALLVDPSNVLLHTFRERARPSGICAMLLSGCLRPDCGLRHIKTLSRCAEVLSTFQSADLPMFLLKIGSPKVERTSDDLLSRKRKVP
jgi:hypothetical protein